MEATISEGPTMVRCNVKNGRPLWHCPRMFVQDYRDVKGQLVPYKSCPQHRASINKSSKTPAAKARLERNKHTEKGKITNQEYANGPKRKASIDKFNKTKKKKVSANRYANSVHGKAKRNEYLCSKFHAENPEYSTTECVVCE